MERFFVAMALWPEEGRAASAPRLAAEVEEFLAAAMPRRCRPPGAPGLAPAGDRSMGIACARSIPHPDGRAQGSLNDMTCELTVRAGGPPTWNRLWGGWAREAHSELATQKPAWGRPSS